MAAPLPTYLDRIPNPNESPNALVADRNFNRLEAMVFPSGVSNVIVKNPATSAANVITPTADATALTLQAFTGQTVPVLQVQDATAANVFTVSPAGNTVIAGTLTVAGATSLATVSAGTWNGSPIGAAYGGTGQSAFTVGDILHATGTAALSKLAIGSTGQFLRVTAGSPAWGSLASVDVTTALAFTPVNKAGDTMTGLLVLSGDAVASLNPVTKQQFDVAFASISAGIQVKTAVACGTTGNITLSGEQTIDGVLTSGSRVLVKDQSTGAQNGIYVSAAGAWTRATDMDAGSEFPGALVYISGGTTNIGNQWYCTNSGTVTVGTTAITWTLYYNSVDYVGGAGIVKTGVTFDIVTASSSRIVVNADSIDLATTAITPGTYPKATYDAYGRATAGSALSSGDVTTGLGFTPVTNARTISTTSPLAGGGALSANLTLSINTNGISDTLLRQSNGLSVVGRSANSTGNVADIIAGTDGHVLRRSGTTLGFGTLPVASITGLATIATSGSASDLTAGTLPGARFPALTGAVTTSAGSLATTLAVDIVGDTNLRNSAALSVIGRSASTSGDPADITAGTDGYVLRRSGTTLAFGQISSGGLLDNAVTLGKLATIAANTFLGNNTGLSSTPIALTVAQTKTALSLNNVENTALSTWAGSSNITTVGTLVPDVTVSSSNSGNPNFLILRNTSNTANSHAAVNIAVGGTSSGDPKIIFDTNGGSTFSFGIDNSASDALVISRGGLLGTDNVLSFNSSTLAATFTGAIGASNLSGTNTGDQTTISGNAGSATVLQTSRTINGVSFNGSANITVAAAAGTLTGSTLAGGVTASSLTSVGTLGNLHVSGAIGIGVAPSTYKLRIKTTGTTSQSLFLCENSSGTAIIEGEITAGGHGSMNLRNSAGAATVSLNASGVSTFGVSVTVDGAFSAETGKVRTSGNAINGSATNRGHMIVGTSASTQVQIDHNQIQAMNNNTPSTLYLNNNGGDVNIQRLVISQSVAAGWPPLTPSTPIDGMLHIHRTTGSTRYFMARIDGAWCYVVMATV